MYDGYSKKVSGIAVAGSAALLFWMLALKNTEMDIQV